MYEILHIKPLDSSYHHTSISDDTTGTSADVWTPAAGKQIHLVGGLVSAPAAGKIQIRDKTAAADIAVLSLNAKGTVPFNLNGDLVLPEDHVIEAKFTIDAGTGTADITLIGYEL